jgi:hypothetical protein
MTTVRGPLAAAAVVMLLLAPGTGAAAAGPGLAIDPNAGPPGTSATVTGAGFCGSPCTPVSIEFNGLPVAQGVTVTPSGSFRVTITVPGGTTAGSDQVAATQQDAASPPQTLRAITYFAVTPSVAAPTTYPTTTAPGAPPTSPATGAPTTAPQVTSTTSAGKDTRTKPTGRPDVPATTTATTARASAPASTHRAGSDMAVIIGVSVPAFILAVALGFLGFRRLRARRP